MEFPSPADIHVCEICRIRKRQRMLVYLSSMTLGDCGHCHVTGQPATSPTHIRCQYKYSPKPETSVFRHSQRTSVPAPWNLVPQLANMWLHPSPSRGSPVISRDPGQLASRSKHQVRGVPAHQILQSPQKAHSGAHKKQVTSSSRHP